MKPRITVMLLEQTIDKLIAMKLFALAKSPKERLERQDHQSLSKAEFIGLLVDDEWLHRENRKLSARSRRNCHLTWRMPGPGAAAHNVLIPAILNGRPRHFAIDLILVPNRRHRARR